MALVIYFRSLRRPIPFTPNNPPVRKGQPDLPTLPLNFTVNDTMTNSLEAIRSLDELRALVHKMLCERENILQDQFGLDETVLIRNGQECGLHFWVRGPRSVRLEAIWVADRNTVYFLS